MLPNIFVLYFTLTYASGIYASECEEYIIIMPVNAMCDPVQVDNIDWPNLDCSHNSTDILTYNEFTANKKCVLELHYMPTNDSCKPKSKTLASTQHTPESTEATTTIKGTFNVSDEKTKQDHTNPMDGINLIFLDHDSIDFSELFDYKKSIASKVIIYCNYTQTVCLDENKIAVNDDFNSNIHTIFVSIVKVNISKPSMNYNMNINNTTNINCISPNGSLDQEITIATLYNILEMYHCNNRTFDGQVNNLSVIVNHKVNAYFPPELLSNNTKIDSIKCTYKIIFINKQTAKVECEALVSTANDDNVTNKYVDDNTTGFNNRYYLIWNCDYTNVNAAVICDQIQSQKYKSIQFLNCIEDRSNESDIIRNNKNITSYNYIINLKKKELPLNAKGTYIKNLETGLLSKNLQLYFTLNKSDFESLSPFRITTGSVFNMWTNDDEEIINRHYNSSLIELNLLNCTICNSTLIKNNNKSVKLLTLDIIINKQDTTSLSFLIEQKLNKNNDNDMNIAIINCILPNLAKLSNVSTSSIKRKLKLECVFEDFEKYINNIRANASINYSSSTVPCKTNYTKLVTSTTLKESKNIKKGLHTEIEKGQNKKHITTLTEITTKRSVIDLIETTIKETTKNLERKLKEEIATLKSTDTTKPYSQHQQGFTSIKPKTNKHIVKNLKNIKKGLQKEKEQKNKHITTSTDITTKRSDIDLIETTIQETTKNPEWKPKEDTTLKLTEYTTKPNSQDQSGFTGIKLKTNENEYYMSPIMYTLISMGSICFISIVIIIGIKRWKPSYKYTSVARRDPHNTEESSL